MRELVEFVHELANFEKYLCVKFEEGLTLEIRENMSISGSQSYKEVVQLALRVEKLTSERISQGSFQKRKCFSLMLQQSLKKSRSSDSSGFGTRSVNSPQTIRLPQSSKLGTSPSSSAFRGRTMSKRCPHCR